VDGFMEMEEIDVSFLSNRTWTRLSLEKER
jgi:hypothetical protein